MTQTTAPAAPQDLLAPFDPTGDAPGGSETARAGRILLAVVLFLGLWATAVVKFGVPGLYIPALALVPVIWTLILFITWG